MAFINKAARQDAALKEEILEEIATGEVPVEVSFEDINDVPAALTSAQAAGTASIRALGTTATTAAAGNHSHAITADADSGLAAAANLQAAFVALSARIKALEDAV